MWEHHFFGLSQEPRSLGKHARCNDGPPNELRHKLLTLSGTWCYMVWEAFLRKKRRRGTFCFLVLCFFSWFQAAFLKNKNVAVMNNSMGFRKQNMKPKRSGWLFILSMGFKAGVCSDSKSLNRLVGVSYSDPNLLNRLVGVACSDPNLLNRLVGAGCSAPISSKNS